MSRALAAAVSLYGRDAAALALAHVAHADAASIRASGHRAVLRTGDDARRVPRAELRALAAAIPAHVETCDACRAVAARDVADALAPWLEPGMPLD